MPGFTNFLLALCPPRTQATVWWGSCGRHCMGAGDLEQGLLPTVLKGLRSTQNLRMWQLSTCLLSNFLVWPSLTKPTWQPRPCWPPFTTWCPAPQVRGFSWEALTCTRAQNARSWQVSSPNLLPSSCPSQLTVSCRLAERQCGLIKVVLEFRAKGTWATIPYY